MAQARGSITEADQQFTETWENIATHGNGVIRLDRRGDEVMELITGRRRFFITTEERLVTEDRILDPKDNPFKNGSFRPVVVPDSIDIESNPNALSDEEIKTIFVASDLAWNEWIKTLDSDQTLRRMLDLAGDSDISLKRFKQIGDRLREVKPPTRIVQRDQDAYDAMGGGSAPQGASTNSRTVAAGTGNPRRGQSGRSSDYR